MYTIIMYMFELNKKSHNLLSYVSFHKKKTLLLRQYAKNVVVYVHFIHNKILLLVHIIIWKISIFKSKINRAFHLWKPSKESEEQRFKEETLFLLILFYQQANI
jgi:hypothetical protein